MSRFLNFRNYYFCGLITNYIAYCNVANIVNKYSLTGLQNKLEFHLALWKSICQILFALSRYKFTFFTSLKGNFPVPLPIDLVRMKSCMPGRKLYFTWTI